LAGEGDLASAKDQEEGDPASAEDQELAIIKVIYISCSMKLSDSLNALVRKNASVLLVQSFVQSLVLHGSEFCFREGLLICGIMSLGSCALMHDKTLVNKEREFLIV
jgi:hypothetical protein